MEKFKAFLQQRYIRNILFISFLPLIGVYLYRHPELLESILRIDKSQFFCLSGAIILTFIINGLSLKVILAKFNTHLPFKECFGLSIATTMGNYLFTKAGTVANSYYLKKRYNLAISSFVAMFGAAQIINLLVVSLVGLLITVTFVVSGDKAVTPLMIFYGIIFFTVLAGIIFFVRVKEVKSSSKIMNFILSILNSWSIIRKDRVCLTLISLLRLAGILSFSFRLFICYHIIDKPIPYLFCLLLATLISLSTLVNIVPANIGVREAIIGLASKIIGSGFESGFFATAVDRIVSMLWIFLLGGVVVLFFINIREMRQEKNQEENALQ